MESQEVLKDQIIQFCQNQGADIIGFAPVKRWEEAREVSSEFWPHSLWSPARTVIVIGIAMPLPIVETTPSILHKETYDTANRELDGLAYNLVRYLNRLGYSSFFFTRDGFGSFRVLKKRPGAAFSHIMAAKYAGLGTIGLNNCLLTPEFGPRVRLVSVFTSADLDADSLVEKDLCIKCRACIKCCPANALSFKEDKISFDTNACLEQHRELTKRRCYPCGICTKVCPIGQDRQLYNQKGIMKKYLDEKERLLKNPNDPAYQAWTHIRKYGSWQTDELTPDN